MKNISPKDFLKSGKCYFPDLREKNPIDEKKSDILFTPEICKAEMGFSKIG